MINAILTDNGITHTLNISGHSGYAVKGQDIICAGVSALSTAYAMQIQNMAEEERVTFPSIQTDDGYLEMIFDDEEDNSKDLRQMLCEGLEAIADMYPEYVNFKKESC